jgi:regulator of protease activity HflC (stomatin/prohibitin superfamily)
MEPATIVLLVLGAVLAIFLIGIFFGSFFTIEQAHAGVVQRLGKFLRIAPSRA